MNNPVSLHAQLFVSLLAKRARLHVLVNEATFGVGTLAQHKPSEDPELLQFIVIKKSHCQDTPLTCSIKMVEHTTQLVFLNHNIKQLTELLVSSNAIHEESFSLTSLEEGFLTRPVGVCSWFLPI